MFTFVNSNQSCFSHFSFSGGSLRVGGLLFFGSFERVFLSDAVFWCVILGGRKEQCLFNATNQLSLFLSINRVVVFMFQRNVLIL